MKRARRHYGIGLGLLFRENKDPEENSYTSDFDNQKYCSGRVNWLISKVCDRIPSVYTIFVLANGNIAQGEEVFQDTFRSISLVTRYTPGESASASMPLFSSALNDPPEYHANPSTSLLYLHQNQISFPVSKVETNWL
jgi:hypothetical protein